MMQSNGLKGQQRSAQGNALGDDECIPHRPEKAKGL